MAWPGMKPENEADRKRRLEGFNRWWKRVTDDTAIPPGGDFYDTARWNSLRTRTIMKYGNKCQKCGFGGDSSNPIQVDHVKPRSKYPELQWEQSNLQVLCKSCNKDKSNKHETDWRTW